ncbi:GtrA family protein [Tepidibacter mesophilus]|uniref:GtrA family protein n=1 Tax=Tepidibacter mesophilus TaxID=655607 RepID=UPI000C0881A9|nr:GtrA family protein [Tepidibacter mesophilus]
MKKFVKKFNNQFMRFVIVGGINTFNFYVLYYLLLLNINYKISYIVAYILSMIGSYFLNTYFVYKQAPSWAKFFQFPLVYIVQLILNFVFVYVCVEWLFISKEWAPIILIPISVPITFFISRYIIARNANAKA